MMFIYGRIVIHFNYISTESRNTKEFSHSDFKMVFSFAIGRILATILKSISKAATKKNWEFILKCKNINQLALGLEYKLKIAVETFFSVTSLILVRFKVTVYPDMIYAWGTEDFDLFFFYYACTACFSNRSQRLKSKLQA